MLVIAEYERNQVRSAVRSALSAAAEIAANTEESIELLVLGSELDVVAQDASRFAPVVVADHPLLAHPTADRYAQVIAEVARARGATTIVAASTTFSRDILPRATALLKGAMASDVSGFRRADGQLLFRRPVYAGTATAIIALTGTPRVITVCPSMFPSQEITGRTHTITRFTVNPADLPNETEYLGLVSRPTNRPEITEARVVVSGGRALRDSDEFDRYVGGLADTLHGAVGCTRALVDAGIAPNEWQIGQTGKVVAPQLYVALGISGSIQHIAGMRNSKIVVAINSDPEAPIFSIANYGLVGDLRELVPRLIEELRASN